MRRKIPMRNHKSPNRKKQMLKTHLVTSAPLTNKKVAAHKNKKTTGQDLATKKTRLLLKKIRVKSQRLFLKYKTILRN